MSEHASLHRHAINRLERTLDMRRQHGPPQRSGARSVRCEICNEAMPEVGGMCNPCRTRMLASVLAGGTDQADGVPAAARRPAGMLERVPGTLYKASPDQRRRVSFVTDAIAELTGYPADEFRAGRKTLRDIVHEQDREALRDALQGEHLVRGFELEYRIITATGEVRWVSDRGRRSGRTAPFWDEGLLVDITEKRRSYDQLLHEARHDPLTGAANRRALVERLTEECARSERSGAPLAVLTMDADHFKNVNDTHGHDAGDRVLVDLADRFAKAVRVYDLVARVGGEEFVVVLLGASPAEGELLGERVRAQVEDSPCGGLPVTVSVGCASWRPGDTCDALLKRADLALYAAKQAGRNRVVSADAETPSR